MKFKNTKGNRDWGTEALADLCSNLLSIKKGKKVCKVTALPCYQCFSLRFLLAKQSDHPKKLLQLSLVNCAGAQ